MLETQKRWVATWRAAGVALAEVRAEELRSMTPAQALQAAESLLALALPSRDLPRWRRLKEEPHACERLEALFRSLGS